MTEIRKGLNMGALDDFSPRPIDERRDALPEQEIGTWQSREPRSMPTELVQLGMRAPLKDVEKFKWYCREERYSYPQMLRRMIKAYEAYQNKDELGS